MGIGDNVGSTVSKTVGSAVGRALGFGEGSTVGDGDFNLLGYSTMMLPLVPMI